MKKALYCSVFSACLLGSPAAVAMGVGFSSGSLGPIVEGSFNISKSFGARLGFGVMLGMTSLEVGSRYTFYADIEHAAALLDYHPWQGNFRLTAGAMKNTLTWAFQETGAGSYKFGGEVFNGSHIGLVDSGTHYGEGVAPYIGLGWSTGFDKERGLSFNGDLGVLYKSAPTLSFEVDCASGVSQTDCAHIKSSAQAEQDSRQLDDSLLRLLQFYPVVNMGLSYKF